jgi:hypothetical protein
VIVGIVLLWASGLSWSKHHDPASTLLEQVGGLLIASVAISALWDLVGKRSFLQEVHADNQAQFDEIRKSIEQMRQVAEVHQSIVASGLETICTDYNKVVDWDQALATAQEVDVFAAWATTWRNNHLTRLTELARKSGTRIRILLPDPTDTNGLKTLALRFNMTQLDVKNKLNEAIDGYKKLDQGNIPGQVKIYTSSIFHAFTAYRIDDQFVVTLYHHADTRSGSIPALRCHKGGDLFKFFYDDLEGAINAGTTKQIYP